MPVPRLRLGTGGGRGGCGLPCCAPLNDAVDKGDRRVLTNSKRAVSSRYAGVTISAASPEEHGATVR